jgi:monovalent cation/hydrogen antiporter
MAMLKRRTQERGLAAWERLGRPTSEAATPSQRCVQLRLAMLEAERAKVLELRRGGQYAGSDEDRYGNSRLGVT